MKKFLALLMATLILFSFAACGNKKEKMKMADGYTGVAEVNMYATTESKQELDMTAPGEVAGGGTTGSLKTVYTGNRKIVRNADLSLSTEKFKETISAIEKAVSGVSGYIASSNEDKYSTYTNLYLTVRVPAEKLDEFLAAIDGTATVTSKSISSDDITSSYADTESHLDALRTEQETLLGLLEKANNLSEILEIQDRLTEVRSSIEYYQSMMNTYNDELEYSTVTMSITEVKHEIETGEGFWSSMWKGLKESFYDVGVGIANFFSWIIVHIPYLVIFAVIILVLCVIIKKIRNKRKSKKAQKELKDAGQTDNSDVS